MPKQSKETIFSMIPIFDIDLSKNIAKATISILAFHRQSKNGSTEQTYQVWRFYPNFSERSNHIVKEDFEFFSKRVVYTNDPPEPGLLVITTIESRQNHIILLY